MMKGIDGGACIVFCDAKALFLSLVVLIQHRAGRGDTGCTYEAKCRWALWNSAYQVGTVRRASKYATVGSCAIPDTAATRHISHLLAMDALITCAVYRRLESAPASLPGLAGKAEEARPLLFRCVSFHKGMSRRKVSWDIFSEELTFHDDDPSMCISLSMLKPIELSLYSKDSRRSSAASTNQSVC